MTSLQYLKGLGPKRAELFKRLGVNTVEDLLFYFPRKWEDRRINCAAKMPPPYLSQAQVIFGRVLSVRDLYTSSALRIFKIIIDAGGYQAEASWFKRHNPRFDVFTPLRKDIVPGAQLWLLVVPEDPLFKTRLRVEEYYLADDARAQQIHINRIVPVYGLTEGLSAKFVREIMRLALDERAGETAEFLPDSVLSGRGLLPRAMAVKAVHFPNTEFDLQAARKRLVYEEFFLLAIAWGLKRLQLRNQNKGFSYEVKKTLLTPFRNRLGFELTGSQKKAINEIFADMSGPSPMARLLEGDVGSGKTVVALSAMLLAVENGGQCAFMAPTEILAEQHFLTLTKYLKELPLRFALLVSGLKVKEKKEILSGLENGEIDIVIGTHAVIQEGVKFKNLRLAVIDEQHRFGVRQRSALRGKGKHADLLVMTATPIPRTLFLALYGDLELSVLTETPPGRKPIKTEIADEATAINAVRTEILKRRQAYIVYPVIEESEAKSLKAVKAEYEKIRAAFSGFNVAALHGRMPAKAKDRIMGEFSAGKIHILVATQVIEVGIDVPNATIMVINNADNFGLASLHQLRGRVGRGRWDSRCLLIPETASADGAERLKVMCETNSGFEISEKDSYLRGTGEILGLKQHGEMEFKLADLSSDGAILRQALQDRDALLSADPDLSKPEHFFLRKALIKQYQEKWHIIDLS